MEWSFIECEEVEKKFKRLDKFSKNIFFYFLGEAEPKVGEESQPKKKNNLKKNYSTKANEEDFLPVRGYPHPKYKDLILDHFCFNTGKQHWTEGEWYKPKKIPVFLTKKLLEEDLKWCPKCNYLKKTSDFKFQKGRLGNLMAVCKACDLKVNRKLQKKESYKEKKKIARKKNRPRENELARIWRKNNSDKVKKYRRKCQLKWIKTEMGLLHRRLSHAMWRTLRNNGFDKNYTPTEGILGCKIKDFIKKFYKEKPNKTSLQEYMSEYDLDHIIPFSLCIQIYKRKIKNEDFLIRLVYALWHYSNLQPLKSDENQYKKSDFVDGKRVRYMSDEELLGTAEKLIDKTEAIRKLDAKKLTPKSEL